METSRGDTAVETRRVDAAAASRGGAAVATRIFRGDKSRRRRGCDVDISWRRDGSDVALRRDWRAPQVPAAGRSPLLVDDAFFFDSLYIHAAPAPENRVQHVFDALLKVAGARAKASFSFETTSSTTKVQTFLFVLSSHPLLRGDSQTAVLAALDAAPDGDGGT